VTGGTVNMVGVQHNNYGAASPPPPPALSATPAHWRLHDVTAGHDIFLSYSRKDIQLMRRVRDDLQAAALRVWTDESLTPGTPSWKKAIETAIEGAKCLVVLLSPDSKQSEWVSKELDYARAQGLNLFPALVRGNERTAVPFALIGSQWVDLQHDYDGELQKLIASLLK
jgi:TIR domain-containing protein